MLNILNKHKYNILGWGLLIFSYIISKDNPFNFSIKTATIISIIMLIFSITSFILSVLLKKDINQLKLLAKLFIINIILAIIIFIILNFIN